MLRTWWLVLLKVAILWTEELATHLLFRFVFRFFFPSSSSLILFFLVDGSSPLESSTKSSFFPLYKSRYVVKLHTLFTVYSSFSGVIGHTSYGSAIPGLESRIWLRIENQVWIIKLFHSGYKYAHSTSSTCDSPKQLSTDVGQIQYEKGSVARLAKHLGKAYFTLKDELPAHFHL